MATADVKDTPVGSSTNCAPNSLITNNAKPGAAKKLIIKNFEKPKLPENYFERTWEKLEEAVVAIQMSKPVSTPFEELYKAVENLCSHKMAADVYKKLESLCEQHVKFNINQFLDAGTDNVSFLKLMDNCWQAHCRQMVRLSTLRF